MPYLTKVRKWIEETDGAEIIRVSDDFKRMTIEYQGMKFRVEQKTKSTSTKVINRGRGLKWAGNPKGVYLDGIQERSQAHLIERIKERTENE
ncbi:hypothetical protein ACFSCX_06040 [Bacillus salitolerans]|uniref:Uncharacterized protein n=1 Tax=Bacillus salitolerans TaxID=1437434 RepID=A0ABW4LNR9_9BACI